jgi:hypothetical protein
MLKGWKTFIVAALVALAGVAQQADWISLIGPTNAGYVLTGVGVLMAILRLLTNTPAGSGTPNP